MRQIKIIALNKQSVLSLVRFAILLAIATLAPLFHFQPITGPIVNAVFFIAVALVGAQNTVLIGLLPSLIALSTGLLPALLAPMIPFIMVSNIILIITFSYFKERNFFAAVVVSSVLKFLFLASTSQIVVHLITQKIIAQKAALMMGWWQLITALIGGIIAYFALRIIKK